MVFNIASASLVLQSYQHNSTDSPVTYTEFALSITEIAFVCFNIWRILSLVKKGVHVSISFSLLIVQCFNIAYSAYVIEYFNGQRDVTTYLSNMALAIIILNTLTICGCCIGGHTVITDKEGKPVLGGGGGGGGRPFTTTWTLSQV